MNKRQKVVLWVGLGLFVFMGLFPPLSRGYGCLVTTRSSIQFGKLLIQWLILSPVIPGFIYALRGDKKISDALWFVIGVAILIFIILVCVAATSGPRPIPRIIAPP